MIDVVMLYALVVLPRAGMAYAEEARVSIEALSNGGEDGRGLLRG